MSNKGEIIILTGAGASQCIGIPAMQGMFTSFIRQSILQDRKVCEMFIEDLQVERDLEEFLQVANTIIDPQTEKIWNFIKKRISPTRSGSKTQSVKNKLENNIDNIKSTRKHILAFVSKTCFQFQRDKAMEIMGAIIKAVAAKGYPIYTTNYDFAPEYVAGEKGIPVNDNFTSVGRRQLWNPEIEFPLGNAITIVKLHGSVSWYSDEKGTVEKIEVGTTINTAGYSVKNLVIFPTRFKDIYEQQYFPLYTHFLTELSSAKCLIVIGHSLRDEYIRAAIIERMRKGRFDLVILDPAWPNALESNLKPAKGQTTNNVTHIPLKFEDFSNELASIIAYNDVNTVGSACLSAMRQMNIKSKLKIKGKIGILKPGATKRFSASIDAYVPLGKRPVCVRAWLWAEYEKNGESKINMTPTFLELEDTTIKIGDEESGIIKQDVPLSITIPKYDDWLQSAGKIVLKVALATTSSSRPRLLKNSDIIATDSRTLTYRE